MSGESLTALLRRTKQTLCVPAAEYVPAMGDAMLLLDRAIQMSYQTDPCWLSSSAAERAVVEALMDATAHLAGSASAYRKYARRHSSVGRSEIDPFFTTRADDFDKAVERARRALSSVRGEGGDKQARPSGSAPISTDTKGTTK